MIEIAIGTIVIMCALITIVAAVTFSVMCYKYIKSLLDE